MNFFFDLVENVIDRAFEFGAEGLEAGTELAGEEGTAGDAIIDCVLGTGLGMAFGAGYGAAESILEGLFGDD